MPEYEVGHQEILPEGVYTFICIDAVEKTSQAGNTTIELQLMVKEANGDNEVRIFDHLTFTPKSTWKIDDFRAATGEILVKGQRSRFESEDCIDRQGKVRLKIETFEGRERNKVEEYLNPNAEKPPPSANASSQAPLPKSPSPKAEKTLEQEFRKKGADEEDIPMN
jgi:hypothetical protein